MYGAYFGAGLGILTLAVLGILLPDDIQHSNALKGMLSLVINGMAVVYFVAFGPVRWAPALIMAGGSMLAATWGLAWPQIGPKMAAVGRGLLRTRRRRGARCPLVTQLVWHPRFRLYLTLTRAWSVKMLFSARLVSRQPNDLSAEAWQSLVADQLRAVKSQYDQGKIKAIYREAGLGVLAIYDASDAARWISSWLSSPCTATSSTQPCTLSGHGALAAEYLEAPCTRPHTPTTSGSPCLMGQRRDGGHHAA